MIFKTARAHRHMFFSVVSASSFQPQPPDLLIFPFPASEIRLSIASFISSFKDVADVLLLFLVPKGLRLVILAIISSSSYVPILCQASISITTTYIIFFYLISLSCLIVSDSVSSWESTVAHFFCCYLSFIHFDYDQVFRYTRHHGIQYDNSLGEFVINLLHRIGLCCLINVLVCCNLLFIFF